MYFSFPSHYLKRNKHVAVNDPPGDSRFAYREKSRNFPSRGKEKPLVANFCCVPTDSFITRLYKKKNIAVKARSNETHRPQDYIKGEKIKLS